MIYFVIDASVARSSKDPAVDAEATSCYLLLRTLSAEAHCGVIVNPALDFEWQKHGSRTFVRWLARMETRRRVKHVAEKRFNDYRTAIDGVADEGVRNALKKDLHLVELALMGSNPVVSRDERQRRYVADLGSSYPLVGAISWFNPVVDDELGWTEWVKSGCAHKRFHLAGMSD